MAHVKFEVGAEVDIASGSELSDFREETLRKFRTFRPINRTLNASLVFNTGSPKTNYLNFQGPARGRVWNVLNIIVVGADDHTTVANANPIPYVGSDPTDPILTQLVQPGATTVPYSIYISKDIIWAHDTEQLFVVMNGAVTNGTSFTGVARVREWRLEDIEAMYA